MQLDRNPGKAAVEGKGAGGEGIYRPFLIPGPLFHAQRSNGSANPNQVAEQVRCIVPPFILGDYPRKPSQRRRQIFPGAVH